MAMSVQWRLSFNESLNIVSVLHGQDHGVFVMRGIVGYGGSGVVHEASLADLSLNLPLVLEFFDLPEKAQRATERIADSIEPGHVVSWPVTVEGGALRPTASR